MAFTETQAGHTGYPGDATSATSATIRSIGSTHSLRSIRSLREIPVVETSFDVDFNTILGDRSLTNTNAAYFSTPRYSRYSDAGSNSPALDSPWSSRASPTNKRRESVLYKELHHNPHSRKESFDEQLRTEPKPDEQARQFKFMEDIARSAGALASMNEYVGTWAPTAHYVVVAAAALQRDSAAFASALTNLVATDSSMDPNNFASQYYQLREAYSSLLSLGDFSTIIYGQQGWTRASSRNAPPSFESKSYSQQSMETSWDERQLVDSFVTLLRTSPGFIASSIVQMTHVELESFCTDGDGSPLNVLFHGVLGSAKKYRPRLLAEVLKSIEPCHDKYRSFAEVMLKRFLGLAVGSLSERTSLKLERYLRTHLSNPAEISSFEPVLVACIPEELTIFIGSLSSSDHLENLAVRELLHSYMIDFAYQLIVYPHQFGILTDTYIDEQSRSNLERVAENAVPDVEQLLSRLLSGGSAERVSDPCWQPDELIALKGSDIILLYNALLPARESYSSSSLPSVSSNNDDDEWCLDSIRTDLVPVMQGLAHSTVKRPDGWQIFKVGDEGLVTDLGSDMGLISYDEADEDLNPRILAVCNAVALHNGDSVSARIEAARNDAALSGDHATLLYLQGAQTKLMSSHVDAMNDRVTSLKAKCRSLRSMLDQAARDQRRERERLSKLLAILDSCRVHIWYTYEVRLSSQYHKAREFMRSLYPNSGSPDDERLDGNLGDSVNGGNGSGTNTHTTSKSRRLSLLGTHAIPESPFHSKDVFQTRKLTDKEVDAVNLFIKRNRVRNVIPAEEIFQRALVEIALFSRKLVHRDHLASSVTFKRDRHYQKQYAQQQAGVQQNMTRHSQHHRRSSLGLFDFFDTSNHQQTLPLTLHTTTSTQFLGLAESHDSLKCSSSSIFTSRNGRNSADDYSSKDSLSPPRYPSLAEVQTLVLSDLGKIVIKRGTETDSYIQQTGQMLLEGEIQNYKPLFDDITLAGSPESKLTAIESLMSFTRCDLQQHSSTGISRSDMVHGLSKVLCREPGTIYRDLQIISMLVNPGRLDRSPAFEDCCIAAGIVLNTVVLRSMDYASRFLRYYLETSGNTAPKMALMGINDSVAIWAFCAKQGNPEARQKLAELYLKFNHLKLEVSPLSRPSSIVDGVDASSIREAVAMHWMGLASQV